MHLTDNIVEPANDLSAYISSSVVANSPAYINATLGQHLADCPTIDSAMTESIKSFDRLAI
ncbi:hypothetical protein [Shigella flexneri]|uniref:hypothetical protein n=1 Tax=Shigella flexneri TaxID=623 RepID=UPI001995530A|nr:hypothetical protein [Escherichia coli]